MQPLQQIKRRPGAASGSRQRPPVPAGSNLRDGILPTLGSAKKILDILEGKRVLTPPKVLPPVKEPAVEALEVHPLAQDQAKYLATNLRRFKNKRKTQDGNPALGGNGSGGGGGGGSAINNELFSRVIQDLDADKQRALLQTLSKISKSLEFGGLLMHEDEAGVVSSPVLASKTISEPLSANASIKPVGAAAAAAAAQSHFGRGAADDGGGGGGSISSSSSSLAAGSIGGSSAGNDSQSLGHGASGSSLGQLSLTGSYASARSYGRAEPDSSHAESLAILDRIGAGMHAHPAAEQRYDLSGRAQIELVPPTALVARIHSDFAVSLSTADIATLMRKFDLDARGVVSIADVLGSAKNVHSRTIYRDTMDGIAKEAAVQRRLLLERRAEYRARVGGKEPDGSEVEGSARRDAMHAIIDKLSLAAYEAIRAKALRPLNAARPKLFPTEFKALLLELNCQLSTREAFVLERRYFQGQTGTVDAAMFRAEFVALGRDMIRDSRRVDAMQSFVRALSRGGTGAGGDGGGDGAAAAGSRAGSRPGPGSDGDGSSVGGSPSVASSLTGDALSLSSVAAGGAPPGLGLGLGTGSGSGWGAGSGSGSGSGPEQAAAARQAAQAAAARSKMSIEMAEDWIGDPLQPRLTLRPTPAAAAASAAAAATTAVTAAAAAAAATTTTTTAAATAAVAGAVSNRINSRSNSGGGSRPSSHSVSFLDDQTEAGAGARAGAGAGAEEEEDEEGGEGEGEGEGRGLAAPRLQAPSPHPSSPSASSPGSLRPLVTADLARVGHGESFEENSGFTLPFALAAAGSTGLAGLAGLAGSVGGEQGQPPSRGGLSSSSSSSRGGGKSRGEARVKFAGFEDLA